MTYSDDFTSYPARPAGTSTPRVDAEHRAAAREGLELVGCAVGDEAGVAHELDAGRYQSGELSEQRSRVVDRHLDQPHGSGPLALAERRIRFGLRVAHPVGAGKSADDVLVHRRRPSA